MTELTQEQRIQLENERVLGKKAKAAYTAYIEEFCQLKRESLFMAFSQLPLTAEKEMMEIKRMLYAIDTLEEDIIGQINTGRMASESLRQVQPDETRKR